MLFSSFAVLLVLQFSMISPHQLTQFSVPLIIRNMALKGEQEQLCLQTWEDCNVPCIQTGTVLMLVVTKDKFCQLHINKPCALLCFAEYIYQSTKTEWHHCRRFWIVKATHAWFVFSFPPFCSHVDQTSATPHGEDKFVAVQSSYNIAALILFSFYSYSQILTWNNKNSKHKILHPGYFSKELKFFVSANCAS